MLDHPHYRLTRDEIADDLAERAGSTRPPSTILATTQDGRIVAYGSSGIDPVAGDDRPQLHRWGGAARSTAAAGSARR